MRPETELFSSLLTEPGSIDLVAPLLRVEDFLLDEHRAIYQAMLDLIENGQPITPIHIAEKLTIHGWPADRASQVISREMDGAPLPGHAKAYAIMVHEAARKRRLVGAMELLMSRAQEPGANPNELIESFQERIFELQSDKPEMEVAPVREAAISFLEMAHGERQFTGSLVGQPTGIDALDLSTTGIRPGELWGVGALPGRGKTSLALQFAKASAERGDPVLFFSLEMAREELVRRLIGEKFGAWHLRNVGSMSDQNWAQVKEYAAEIATWPLFIDDSARLFAIDIAARARLGIRQRKAKLIIIDYLQLIRGKEREIRDRVGNAANVLRALAKETKVPVVVLSQLRRPGDINARPTMLDFKESGDIESHINTGLLVYMPVADDGRFIGEEEILIGKQRNGPIGSVPVYYDTRSLSFKTRTKAVQ
jgi:replicative DNA helicase